MKAPGYFLSNETDTQLYIMIPHLERWGTGDDGVAYESVRRCSFLGLADHRHNIFGQEIAAADEPAEEQGGQKEGLETGFLKLVEARFST